MDIGALQLKFTTPFPESSNLAGRVGETTAEKVKDIMTSKGHSTDVTVTDSTPGSIVVSLNIKVPEGTSPEVEQRIKDILQKEFCDNPEASLALDVDNKKYEAKEFELLEPSHKGETDKQPSVTSTPTGAAPENKPSSSTELGAEGNLSSSTEAGSDSKPSSSMDQKASTENATASALSTPTTEDEDFVAEAAPDVEVSLRVIEGDEVVVEDEPCNINTGKRVHELKAVVVQYFNLGSPLEDVELWKDGVRMIDSHRLLDYEVDTDEVIEVRCPKTA